MTGAGMYKRTLAERKPSTPAPFYIMATALAALLVLALLMSTAYAKPCGNGHIANNRECHR